MSNLENFVALISGNFDNSEQFNEKEAKGITGYPFAKHITHSCNDKIHNIPPDFKGIFLIEESYYTVNGNMRPQHHLFLFTEINDQIQLTSYDPPAGFDQSTLTYDHIKFIEFSDLKASERFTPAMFSLEGDTWVGGSTSQFSPTVTFTLNEKFSSKQLEVSEIMESGGKRIFGFDDPIIYKRIS